MTTASGLRVKRRGQQRNDPNGEVPQSNQGVISSLRCAPPQKLPTIDDLEASATNGGRTVARVAPMKSMFGGSTGGKAAKRGRNAHNCGELNFKLEYDFEKRRVRRHNQFSARLD